MATDSSTWIAWAQAFVPMGHTVSVASGVRRDKAAITATPIVVDAKFGLPDGKIDALRVRWLMPGATGFDEQRAILPVSEIIEGKWQWGLAMAQRGIDAGSHNHKALASYLMTASVKAPTYKAASRTGWTSDGEFVFPFATFDKNGALNSTSLKLERLESDLTYLTTPNNLPRIDNDGFLEDWMTAVANICGRSPLAALAIYGSLLSPLLGNFGSAPFAIMWSGRSGCGKGIAAELAASVWGSPVLGKYLLPWSSLASSPPKGLGDLPLCLDNLLLTDMRHTCATLQDTILENHNVMVLTTGLDTIEDLVGEESIKSRLLRVWGRPFKPSVTIQDLAELRATLSRHYGVFGPAFLSRLADHRADFSKWFDVWAVAERKSWARECAELPEYAQALGVRCADLVTVSRITQALFPGFLSPDLLKRELYKAVRVEGDKRRSVMVAAEAVKEHVAANVHRVFNPNLKEKQPIPNNGWIGSYDERNRIWILRSVVDLLLRSVGADPVETVGEWITMGGLVITDNGRSWNTIPIGLSKQRGRAIAFKPGFPAAPKKS